MAAKAMERNESGHFTGSKQSAEVPRSPVIEVCHDDSCGTPAASPCSVRVGMVRVGGSKDGAASHWYCHGRCAAIARARTDIRTGGHQMSPAHRTLTQAELWAEAEERFGKDPCNWAFQCPACADIATGTDFQKALIEHPQVDRSPHRAGRPLEYADVLGRECIGRLLGALVGNASRGCNWAAYGLIPGPWMVTVPDHPKPVPSFALAPVPVVEIAQGGETRG